MSFGPKTIKEAQSHKYSAWAGNPAGIKYDPARCMESVYPAGRSFIPYQCQKKIWKDGFCKQHHPDTIKAKNDAREQKYQEERERDRKKWALQSAAPDMLAALTGVQSAFPDLDQFQDKNGYSLAPLAQIIKDAISKAKGEA
jgi:hypothetical protein